MARMTGFVFQDEYLVMLAKLSDQEVGRLVRALAEYHATGETRELAGRESIAYDFIKVDIDRIDEKYEAKCSTNRNNRASTVNDRQRSSTNDNDRQRSSTNEHKDKVKEKDKDKDDDDDTARACETPFGKVEIDPVILMIQQELVGLTQSHYDDLQAFRQDLPDELIEEAVNEAVAHGARSWAYVRSILQGYIRENIRTVGAARARSEKRRNEPKNGGFRSTGWNYEQRHYSEDELAGRTDEI